MRSRILVVARDVALRARLARLLGGAGHRIELAESAAHARRIGRLEGFDLMIAAPEGLGVEGRTLVAELQAATKPPLLLTGTAPSGPSEPGCGALDLADDEGAILARVAEALRRRALPPEAKTEAAPVLRFADYSFDSDSHALIDASGTEIPLTRGEFGLLREFVQRPGRVLSRDHLLGALAGREAEAFDRSVDMLISRLRRKVEPDPKRPSLIVTVPGSGYKLAARVTQDEIVPPEKASPLPRGRPRPDESVAPAAGFSPPAAGHERGAAAGFGDLPARTCENAAHDGMTADAALAPAPSDVSPSAQGERVRGPGREAGGAERRQITVLFCDLVGSTALSSHLDPEDLHEVLAAYHRRVADVIERWAGHIANDLGDGVLAYFGSPQAHEDDAERAVQAGLELAEAVGSPIQRDGPALQVRIGIATGLVVVDGIAGVRGRGAVGAVPNRAARLQVRAEPGTVLVDAGTRRRLAGLFACRDLGPIEAKGLPAPVQAWWVLRRNAVNSHSGALHATAALAPPLVGRDEEIALLRRSWTQAKNGEGRLVLLSGEPGIGKSRLTAALAAGLANESHVLLRYFCSPHHQDSPLFPVTSQLERAAGFDRADTQDARLGKLKVLLARATKQDDEIALLAELMGFPAGDHCLVADLGPQRRRERLLQALLAQLAGLAAQRPVLMLFEDAHWIDPTSLDLLSLVVERIRRLRVLLVVTFRPEFHPPWTGLPHAAALTLGGLGRREAAALVARTAAGARLPEVGVEQIVERSGGVPLFVEELTRAAIEADWHDVPEAAQSAATLPACAVPAALYAPLAARLDRLGSAAREVAQVGAAIGREFTYELLAAVARRPDAELQDALECLVEAGLVFHPGGDPLQATYLFKHALVRDAAYGTLLRARRRELHAAVARAIAGLFPETAAAQPELLAHHYEQAGLVGEAVESWSEAARQATAAAAMAEARAHLARGLALAAEMPVSPARHLHQAELQLALGTVQMATYGFGSPELGAAFAAAAELCRTLPSSEPRRSRLAARALYGDWSYKIGKGDLDASLIVGEELLRLGRDGDDSDLRLFTAHTNGSSCLFLGRLAEARSVFTEALPADHSDGPEIRTADFGLDAEAVFRAQFSRTLACMGFSEQAALQAHLSLERAARLNHLPSLAVSLANASTTFWTMRDARSLQRACSALMTLSSERGFAYWLARGQCYAGWVTAKEGDAERGLRLLTEGVSELRGAGILLCGPHTHAMLSDAYAHNGGREAALDAVDVGLTIMAQSGEAWCGAELHRRKGELLLNGAKDGPVMAEEKFRRAVALAHSQSAKLFELRAATSLARLWSDQGGRRAAHDLLASVLDRFTEGFDAPDVTEACTLLEMLR